MELHPHETRTTIDGVEILLARHGAGRPLVWLHSLDGTDTRAAWFQELARSFEVIAPTLPGFGHSALPREFRRIDDLVQFQATVLEALELKGVLLAGHGFGGWIAAELAARSCERLAGLVLVDAFGVKHGGRDERDIADIYVEPAERLLQMTWADPEAGRIDFSQWSDADLLRVARSREAFASFGWRPYLHNPGLKRWLRRIRVPAQVVWGAADGWVTPEYGRRYAALIPGARFDTLDGAGHYPHLEQPQAFARVVCSFAESLTEHGRAQ
jgi:pimeloyl-ACP methyl ester carboxylesterase